MSASMLMPLVLAAVILNADGTPYVDGQAHGDSPLVTDSPEADDGYFAAGFVLGAHLATKIGGSLELGVRASDTPVFGHAMIAGGDSGLWADGGSFLQLRAGAEGRNCSASGIVCVFAGADLGYEHEDARTTEYGLLGGDIMETVADSLIAVPRVGFDIGREFRVRSTFELPLYPGASDGAKTYGVQGSTSLVFQF